MAKIRVFSVLFATARSKQYLSLVAFLGVVVLAGSTRADVTSVTFSGPGGIASLGPTGGLLTEPALNYNNPTLGPIDVTITVDSADRYYVSETTAFAGITGVENNTGVAWSGFTWELISSPAGALVYLPSSPDFSGIDFTSAFPLPATGTATLGTFSGGTLASGSFFEPAFKIDFPAPGTYVLRETPIGVPEPSAFVLAGLGLLGMGVVARRNKYRRA